MFSEQNMQKFFCLFKLKCFKHKNQQDFWDSKLKINFYKKEDEFFSQLISQSWIENYGWIRWRVPLRISRKADLDWSLIRKESVRRSCQFKSDPSFFSKTESHTNTGLWNNDENLFPNPGDNRTLTKKNKK